MRPKERGRKEEDMVTTVALSLWPEWLWAFTALDKRLENRGWRPPKWLMGKYFCLHAGSRINGGASVMDGLESLAMTARDAGWQHTEIRRKMLDKASYEFECTKGEEKHTFSTETAVRSAIVAVVKLIDVTYDEDRPWAIPHSHHWIFNDTIHVLERPVYCAGQRGLWRLDEAQIRAVHEQVDL